MAELIYDPQLKIGAIDHEQIHEPGWECIELLENKNTGYKGCIFYNSIGHKMAIVHEGTRITKLGDIYADTEMVLGDVPEQRKDADALVQKALRMAKEMDIPTDGESVVNIGHSLGGSLAQLTSYIRPHLPAITFNAYGTGIIVPKEVDGNYQHITNHVAKGDIVSTIAYGSEQIGKSILYKATFNGAEATPHSFIRTKDFLKHTLNHSIKVFNNEKYTFWNQAGQDISLKAPFTRIVATAIQVSRKIKDGIAMGLDMSRAANMAYTMVQKQQIANKFRNDLLKDARREERMNKFLSEKPDKFHSAREKIQYGDRLTLGDLKVLRRAHDAGVLNEKLEVKELEKSTITDLRSRGFLN